MINTITKTKCLLTIFTAMIFNIQCSHVSSRTIENKHFSLISKGSKGILSKYEKNIDESSLLNCVFDDTDSVKFGIKTASNEWQYDKPIALVIYDNNFDKSKIVPFDFQKREYGTPPSYI